MIMMMQKRSFLHASREGNGGMPENEDSRKVERGERTKETGRSSLAKGGGAGKRGAKGKWIMSASMKGSDLVQEKSGEKVVLLVRSLGGRIFPTPHTTAMGVK